MSGKPTNTSMVKLVLCMIQGNTWIDMGWFTCRVNTEFNTNLTRDQVSRAMPSYVKRKNGKIMRKGRATI